MNDIQTCCSAAHSSYPPVLQSFDEENTNHKLVTQPGEEERLMQGGVAGKLLKTSDLEKVEGGKKKGYIGRVKGTRSGYNVPRNQSGTNIR